MHKLLLLSSFVLAGMLSGFEITGVKPDGKTPMTQADTPFFRVVINPMGGRMHSIYSKQLKCELTDHGGSGTENVWNIGKSRFFLQKKPYTLTTHKSADRLVFRNVANHQGGSINFLRVHKDYVFRKDAAKITVNYKLENIDEAMAPVSYGFWLQHIVGIPGSKMTHYFPTVSGIFVIPYNKRPVDTWQFRPSRGWLGGVDPATGRGVALTMSFPELKCLYSWFAGMKIPTTEWRTETMSIPAGKSYDTTAEILPFSGLKKISGAGGGLVGELRGADVETENDSHPIEVIVHNAEKGRISAEVMVRQAPEGKWKSVKKAVLDFKKPGSLAQFKCIVRGEEETLQEIEVILRKGKKELARLNGFVNFDGSEEKWTIDALEEKKIDAQSKIDLLRFTRVNPTPHVKWAAPLPGGKIKTLVLTHGDSILENGELAQRLDMDFTIPYIMVNAKGKVSPIYGLGDYFGVVSAADIDRNLDEALKKDYQLIILGGLYWEHLNSKQQRAILNKVKKGAGLICIGAGRIANFMPFAAGQSRILTRVPEPRAVKKDPVISGVPFDLFGRERILEYKNKSGEVLAAVGRSPYLVRQKLGKGTVYYLSYVANFGRFGDTGGFTPNLKPAYPDRTAPAEYYYSLIAKLAVSAAKRASGVTVSPVFKAKGVELKITAPAARQVTIQLAGNDQFRTRRYSRNIKAALKKGVNSINVPLPLASHARKQVLDVIVRDAEGNSLSWGSWSYNVKSPARIAAVKLDKKYYRDGENVKYNVELKGDAGGVSVKVEYVDTYGRIFPAGSTLTGSFKLTNALCSRIGTLRARIFAGANEIDRLETEFIMTPSAESRKWQDFEIGAWLTGSGPRPHLWPLHARIMKENLIDTGIANWHSMQIHFPARFNIHPTLLRGIGITRCPEPPEYARTGNKLVLKRRPCLSDEAYLERMKKAFVREGKAYAPYALRFYWAGDEQSITGYGGTPVDFCFSDHCLVKFREFVKQKYGTLKVLNSEWNTSFKKWEDVLPFTKDEIWNGKEKSVAGWADHLEFMDGRLENVAATMFSTLKKYDPNARTSLSGTQPSTAYGGMDWSRLLKHFDGLMNYNIGGQFELQRSFRPDGEFMPWSYGYSSKGGILGYNIWRSLFIGMRGVFGFCYPSLVNPDGSLSTNMADSLIHFRNMRQGGSLHWINNLNEYPDIAVLYSHKSIRAAFIEKRHLSRNTVFDKYNELLRACGYNFIYITPEQLEQGALRKGQFRALILPDCGAMSDKEIAEVRRFARAGGILMADGIPAKRYSNCRMRKAPALADCFKLKGNLLKPVIDLKYLEALSFPEKAEFDKLIRNTQAELKKVLGPARGPQLTMNGKAVTDARIFVRKDKKGNVYAGIVTPNKQQRAVTLTMPKAGYMYDLISGRAYGKQQKITLPIFVDAVPVYLAVLDHKPELGKCTLKNNTVTVNMKSKIDTAANIQVISPDGKVVLHYSRPILVNDGRGVYKIPFAPSDAKGTWKIKITELITKKTVTLTVKR